MGNGYGATHVFGEAGHPATHNAIEARFNLASYVTDPLFSSVQDAITKCKTLYFPPGTYNAGNLTIDHDIVITASPGAILNCTGITAQPAVGSYVNVTIKGLDIRNSGAGAIGLYLNKCISRLEDVSIKGFTATGLKIEYGMSSHFGRVICTQNPTGLLVTGSISTTIAFQTCTFDQANIAAVKVEAEVNSISFSDWCVFQSSKRGLVVDSVSVISLINPYFENIEQDLISVGTTAEVQSFVLDNPIAIGGAANDALTDMFVFDRVNMVTWLGGGDCRVPKATWIKTTANTLSAVITEPRHLGLATSFNDLGKVTLNYRNGRLGVNGLQLGANWNLSSSYAFQVGDVVLAAGSKIALYAAPDGSVRISSENVAGVLTGGVEVDNGGVILRSANGSRWRLVVSNAGVLSTVAL